MDIRKPTASGKTTVFAMLLSIFGAGMVFVPWYKPGNLNGMMSWHGIVDLIVWILLFLFLVATSPLKPVPLWRTFPLVAGGALVLLFTGLCIGRFSPAPLDAGVYLEFVSGVALLFVAALEVRGQLIRWQAERLVPAMGDARPAKALDQALHDISARYGARTTGFVAMQLEYPPTPQ